MPCIGSIEHKNSCQMKWFDEFYIIFCCLNFVYRNIILDSGYGCGECLKKKTLSTKNVLNIILWRKIVLKCSTIHNGNGKLITRPFQTVAHPNSKNIY